MSDFNNPESILNNSVDLYVIEGDKVDSIAQIGHLPL